MKIFHCILVLVALMSVSTFAADIKPPAFEDIVKFTADPVKPEPSDYFKDFKITKDDLKAVLRGKVVTREHWLHDYSHVAFGDRSGTIALKDKTKVRWFVKPGGLACLIFADGTQIFLVYHKDK